MESILTKICSKCKLELELCEFEKQIRGLYGCRSYCKECRSIQKSAWYGRNKGRSREKNKNWFKNNKEKRRAYERDRSAKTERRLANNLRKRICEVIKKNVKAGSAVKDLGCTLGDLKLYLESKFYPNRKTGEIMSWENHGFEGWHIDHIIPLASFDLENREQFLKACHYTNLQPLWAEENLSKGNKILGETNEQN